MPLTDTRCSIKPECDRLRDFLEYKPYERDHVIRLLALDYKGFGLTEKERLICAEKELDHRLKVANTPLYELVPPQDLGLSLGKALLREGTVAAYFGMTVAQMRASPLEFLFASVPIVLTDGGRCITVARLKKFLTKNPQYIRGDVINHFPLNLAKVREKWAKKHKADREAAKDRGEGITAKAGKKRTAAKPAAKRTTRAKKSTEKKR